MRGEHAGITELESGLRTIAARYTPMVELLTIAPGELPERFAALAGRTDQVLVLRRGELIGEAMGELPVRELEVVVRCAVEWPDYRV